MKRCSVGLFLMLFIEDLQVSFYNLFILHTLHLFNGVVKSCLFLLKVYTENCKCHKIGSKSHYEMQKIALSSGCTPKSPLGFTEEPWRRDPWLLNSFTTLETSPHGRSLVARSTVEYSEGDSMFSVCPSIHPSVCQNSCCHGNSAKLIRVHNLGPPMYSYTTPFN